MDFEEIDELNEEDMNALYNDIVEFGDETHLVYCWCQSAAIMPYVSLRAGCRSWCRTQGSYCAGWNVYNSTCHTCNHTC